MTIRKNFFDKYNDYYLFHQSQKMTTRRLFKVVYMPYLYNKLQQSTLE